MRIRDVAKIAAGTFGLGLLAVATHHVTKAALPSPAREPGPGRAGPGFQVAPHLPLEDAIRRGQVVRLGTAGGRDERYFHADSPGPGTIRVQGLYHQNAPQGVLSVVARLRVMDGWPVRQERIVWERKYDDQPIRTGVGESRLVPFQETITGLSPGTYFVQWILVHARGTTGPDGRGGVYPDPPGGDRLWSLRTLPPVVVE